MFETPKAVIGRDATADLFLPVQAVSRIHAEVSWDSGRWVLRDLDSRNGILFDGHPVKSAVLEPNSEARIGDALLKYVDTGARVASTYRIDGRMTLQHTRTVKSTELVGGAQMDQIAAEIQRIAKTPLSVMLLGESGTGKEVAARELHQKSGRVGQFHAINCAAIPATLLESELFGYRRGAFSGADRDKPGIIRMADGGTLLLDEIGDMPVEAQAKLLRVLQSREVYPLGATAPEKVDVRIVCATHRDLKKLIRNGDFREDLFARLNEYPLRLPPLRDRKEDLFLLSRTFLERHKHPHLELSYGFMLGLVHYDWPYNVRELEACIKRCCALTDGNTVTEALLPDAVREAMAEYGHVATDRDSNNPPEPTFQPVLVPWGAEFQPTRNSARYSTGTRVTSPLSVANSGRLACRSIAGCSVMGSKSTTSAEVISETYCADQCFGRLPRNTNVLLRHPPYPWSAHDGF